MLEEMLTGKTFEAQLEDSESRPIVEGDEDDEVMIHRIGADFIAAVAAASPEDLLRLAEPWAEIEEFGGMADPRDLAEFLSGFKELADEATASGAAVYCCVSL